MHYKKLEIDFPIPELLETGIEEFLIDLNEKGGKMADCYEQDIRSTLNGCDLCMTEEQIDLLRQYYCKGGIYENAD